MGRSKALVEVGGTRMLARVLASLRAAGLGSIVVVLGDRASDVRAAVDLGGTTVVENADFAEGMASSLRAGVRAVPGHVGHVMIVLADQPFVEPETFRRLTARAAEGDGRIFVPTFRGVWGNPVVFSTALAPEIAAIRGDIGCRAMFPNHTEEIREVPVDDPGTLVDIDTEEELRAVEGPLARGAPLRAALERLSEPRWSLHATPHEHPVPKRLARRTDVSRLAQAMRDRGEPFALATVVRAVRPTSGRPGYAALIRPDGSHVGWVGGACTEHLLVTESLAALAEGAPRLLRVTPDPAAFPSEEGVVNRAMTCQSGGTVEIFIEPNLPKPELLVVGDSPVATSLAALGPLLGYRVVVVAPGVEATELPEVDEVLGDVEGISSRVTASTYAVVASMGKYDESALLELARSPAVFVGLVASRKRAESVLAVLREEGVDEATIGRIRSPAGLDIAASTPEEIALSVMAEITRRRRSAGVARPSSAAPTSATSDAPIAPEAIAPEAIDPVCGMSVATSSPLRTVHEGTTYYFCADGCRRKFVRNPAKYLAPPASG